MSSTLKAIACTKFRSFLSSDHLIATNDLSLCHFWSHVRRFVRIPERSYIVFKVTFLPTSKKEVSNLTLVHVILLEALVIHIISYSIQKIMSMYFCPQIKVFVFFLAYTLFNLRNREFVIVVDVSFLFDYFEGGLNYLN